jgi:hypothetical protein
MKSPIEPSIGRRVWYYASLDDLAPIDRNVKSDANGKLPRPMYCASYEQAMDAGVAYVHEEDHDVLTLTIADHSGEFHRRSDVRYLEEPPTSPGEYSGWTWMPYQRQAKA